LLEAVVLGLLMNDHIQLRIQPVDATVWLNISAGVFAEPAG
jgi:hypothetical protein